jgi:hypothetical protein
VRTTSALEDSSAELGEDFYFSVEEEIEVFGGLNVKKIAKMFENGDGPTRQWWRSSKVTDTNDLSLKECAKAVQKAYGGKKLLLKVKAEGYGRGVYEDIRDVFGDRGNAVEDLALK